MSGTEAVPECSNTATVPSVLHACLGQAKTTAFKGLAEAHWCCKGCRVTRVGWLNCLCPRDLNTFVKRLMLMKNGEDALHFLGVVA